MAISIEQLKQHSILKKQIAKSLNISSKYLQECIEELITFAKSKENNSFTDEELRVFATSEDTKINKLIYGKTEEDQLLIINSLLNSASLLIGINSKIFTLAKQTPPEE